MRLLLLHLNTDSNAPGLTCLLKKLDGMDHAMYLFGKDFHLEFNPYFLNNNCYSFGMSIIMVSQDCGFKWFSTMRMV